MRRVKHEYSFFPVNVLCPVVNDVADGNVTLLNRNGTEIKSVYNVTCDEGYVVEGEYAFYCQNAGEWSFDPNDVTCESKYFVVAYSFA